MSVESIDRCRERSNLSVPCHVGDPELWFAENPLDLERAKALCADCPIRRECLSAALERQEPWGVWGGEIIERGAVIAHKRPRGRPRKDVTAHARSKDVTAHARSKEATAHARSKDVTAHARSKEATAHARSAKGGDATAAA